MVNARRPAGTVKQTSLPLGERRHAAGRARADPAGARNQIQPPGRPARARTVAAVTGRVAGPRPQASSDGDTGAGTAATAATAVRTRGAVRSPAAATAVPPPVTSTRVALAARTSRVRRPARGRVS